MLRRKIRRNDMQKIFLFHKCRRDSGQEVCRFIAMCDSQKEVQKLIDSLKDKKGFCEYSIKCFFTEVCETDKSNWKGGFTDDGSSDKTTPVKSSNVAKPTKSKEIDTPSIVEVGVIELNGYEYKISRGKLNIKINNGEIWLKPVINAKCENEEVDYYIRNLGLYFNGEFNTKLTEISQLKGKKFICDTKMSKNIDYSGGAVLYVVEHEKVTEGILEVIDVDDTNVTFRWYGKANVGWNSKFDKNVPFNATVIAPIITE